MNRTDIEDDLKNALRRQDAPDGLAGRVLARVANEVSGQKAVPRPFWFDFFTRPLVRWVALAAVLASTIFGVRLHNLRRQQAEGEAAKQRLILALRIAGSKLQLAKATVNQINANQLHADQTETPEEKE